MNKTEVSPVNIDSIETASNFSEYINALINKYQYIEAAKALFNSVERKGIGSFIGWLYTTDYFNAPASTKYHEPYEGGLVEHSLKVTHYLSRINDDFLGSKYSKDTIIICGLLHDICKVDFYKIYQRNVKDDSTGKWHKEDAYTVAEKFPFGGHGSKSVYLIQKHGLFITDEEATAINCHMGGWDTTVYHNPSKAFELYNLATALHIADMLASYIPLSGGAKE